jgi:zona occludens toxin (predicted ATPase)
VLHFLGAKSQAAALQERRAKALAAQQVPLATPAATPASPAAAPVVTSAAPAEDKRVTLPEVELWYKKKYGPLTIPGYGACAVGAGLVGLLIRNAVKRKAGL